MLSGVKLTIIGRVQGVYFRHSTKTEARRLGLRGWVRNLGDGSVEVFAVGQRPQIDQLVDWCGKGPSNARVDRVEVKWLGAAAEPGQEELSQDEHKFSELTDIFEIR